ncbi:hypothetical protein NKG94_28300 [Micromonospora sp. M12]
MGEEVAPAPAAPGWTSRLRAVLAIVLGGISLTPLVAVGVTTFRWRVRPGSHRRPRPRRAPSRRRAAPRRPPAGQTVSPISR